MNLCIRSLLIAMLLALVATPALAHTDLDFLGYYDLGYVADQETLAYQHVFDPATYEDADISIESVLLQVWVIDDWSCRSLSGCMGDWFYESEAASIDLNSITWAAGQATASIFWGDITAEADLLANDGILDVTITSEWGDFAVIASILLTEYHYGSGLGGGSGTTPMPEPSAALAFAVGVLALRGAVRKPRR